MKNICQLLLLFITIVFFQSCEKEIEFDSKLIAPKMVINGFIQQDSLISITIGTSKAIPGIEKPNVYINDATVKLFVDGEEKEILSTYDIENRFTNFDPYSPQNIKDYNQITKGYRSQTIKAEAGKTYKLVVSHPNYETVTCETTIPVPINIISIDTITKIEVSDGYSYNRCQVKIKFKDPPDEKNYYRLVYKTLSGYSVSKNNIPDDTDSVISVDIQYFGTYINSDDPIINPSKEDANDLLFGSPMNLYNLFTDNLIEGKEHELTFFFDNYDLKYIFNSSNIDTSIGEFFILNIELQSVSREAYLYMKSVEASNYYIGDFFAEPVQVFTNIENGIGIFAGFSYSSKSITSGEYPMKGIKYQFSNNNYFSNYRD